MAILRWHDVFGYGCRGGAREEARPSLEFGLKGCLALQCSCCLRISGGASYFTEMESKVAQSEQTLFGSHLVIPGLKAESTVRFEFSVIPESDGDPCRDWRNERSFQGCETIQVVVRSVDIRV